MTVKEFPDHVKANFTSTSSVTTGILFMLVDALAIMLSVGASFFIINAIDHSLINFRSFVTYWVYLPLIIVVFYAAKLYPGLMLAPAQEIKNIGISLLFCMAGIACSIVIETDGRTIIGIALFLAAPIGMVSVSMAREITRHILGKTRWWGIPVILYGGQAEVKVIADRLIEHPNYGYRVAAIIWNEPEAGDYRGIPIFDPKGGIERAIHELGIKVAIACDYQGDITELMTAYRYTIKIPRLQTPESMFHEVRDFGGILGLSATNYMTKSLSLLTKRAFDAGIILLFSPLLVPACLAIGILVKLTSEGPVFYGHKRVGKDGREFKCWKFRSMVMNADQMLEGIFAEHPEMREEWEKDRKLTNDPRVTKIGKFLRKTSIDEIPQLWNIFIGEMSFVGPRPVTQPELDKYGPRADYILKVQPGLSGMWQISGRSDTGYEERVNLDIFYIQNWSVWLDFWIILKTAWVVLKRKGAY